MAKRKTKPIRWTLAEIKRARGTPLPPKVKVFLRAERTLPRALRRGFAKMDAEFLLDFHAALEEYDRDLDVRDVYRVAGKILGTATHHGTRSASAKRSHPPRVPEHLIVARFTAWRQSCASNNQAAAKVAAETFTVGECQVQLGRSRILAIVRAWKKAKPTFD